jgi:tetratricopeptide (TPR) repeat protein
MSFLKEKFVPSDPNSLAKKNFFNQLIQIRPPEGINAISASPLIDTNKGWAPSIPSISSTKMKTNLQDLLMRAKGGIQAGDIPKEAHMAFFLGVMNEEEKNYEEALKFYKKYFLSAKLLQDVYGTELALNRISVLYSNILIYDQSLIYSETHKEITTHNVNGFVAFYNCGVCQRILGRLEDSTTSFNRALQMAEEENVLMMIYFIGS